jgi:hypothetical protein
MLRQAAKILLEIRLVRRRGKLHDAKIAAQYFPGLVGIFDAEPFSAQRVPEDHYRRPVWNLAAEGNQNALS